MNEHGISTQSFARQKERTVLKGLTALLLVIMLAGCASLGGESAKKFQEARRVENILVSVNEISLLVS